MLVDENDRTKAIKDLLIVKEWPIMRARAEKIKKVMWLLVQATWDETLITMRKTSNFMSGMEKESRLVHLIQAKEEKELSANNALANIQSF